MKTLNELCTSSVMFAPMVGLSHYAVRASIAEFLPPHQTSLWPSEMLSSRRIPSQKEGQSAETTFLDKQNGICPQILGNEEVFIRASVKKLVEWGAVAIDINMGCPVHKALKHNYGVSLMGDAQYAANVTQMAVKAAHEFSIPVSVKLRAGFEKTTRKELFSFIEGIYKAGASWITLHPRTAEQQRKGDADWDLIGEVKREFKLPIVGNGDVQTLRDLKRLQERTGCDKVMVGRALLAKPWLISNPAVEPSPEEQGHMLGQFLLSVVEKSRGYSEAQALRKMRFLVTIARPWMEFGEFLRGRFHASSSLDEMEGALRKFFAQPQRVIGTSINRY